ncbi:MULTISPECIES: undecaprenyl-phosphate glucose phosphotransferase [Halomonadaceae]|uniref:UDP-glucose:undecaprenyl-phosphate glucose-1-phosphate transferase n=1 Tax=Vreelandella hamiltonii TaxID=502829 RepID=A0A8H9IBK3_9GAMM|nr:MULTISPECIES: undecaprenyl-phosphate glucose phosphotransferase [Halomonas]ATH79342.1 undecaprenyl-phosphate glucose phosphotransferase [Halomonas hydrothermalis]GGW40265.1 UDP-glucose:undecaprenyl-phosphate glucose-1-phosphate transferase [Halomonas hamiltonii]
MHSDSKLGAAQKRGVIFSERYPPKIIFPVFDFVVVVFSGVMAYLLRFETFHLHERYVLALACMALLVVVANSSTGSYKRWRISSTFYIITKLMLVWLVIGIIVTSIIYFAHAAERYSRLWVGLTLLFSFVLAASARALVQYGLRRIRIRGGARRPVFLVGPAKNVLHVARGMRAASWEGHSIAGVERLPDGSLDQEQLERIAARIGDANASEVWICVPLEMGDTVHGLFYALRNHTEEIRLIPEFKDMRLLNHRTSEVAGHLAIDLSVSPINGMARVVKRAEDIIVGSLISLMILPVCIAIALAIKFTSPGPVLFKQHRTGSNGKVFKVYKFRSMKVHQEKEGVVTQATKNDNRLTPIGAFLRRTSLDELPQFYNVLQGRMSIVGPRPHALAHNEYYTELVESYMRRHKVKPGITGWAQVNGLRGETDTLEKMQRRVEYDLWYIDNWSVWLDLKIIFMTVFKGFKHANAY